MPHTLPASLRVSPRHFAKLMSMASSMRMEPAHVLEVAIDTLDLSFRMKDKSTAQKVAPNRHRTRQQTSEPTPPQTINTELAATLARLEKLAKTPRKSQ